MKILKLIFYLELVLSFVFFFGFKRTTTRLLVARCYLSHNLISFHTIAIVRISLTVCTYVVLLSLSLLSVHLVVLVCVKTDDKSQPQNNSSNNNNNKTTAENIQQVNRRFIPKKNRILSLWTMTHVSRLLSMGDPPSSISLRTDLHTGALPNTGRRAVFLRLFSHLTIMRKWMWVYPFLFLREDVLTAAGKTSDGICPIRCTYVI